MEPGHEDREYVQNLRGVAEAAGASMEPGHEDREYWVFRVGVGRPLGCLNGARS